MFIRKLRSAGLPGEEHTDANLLESYLAKGDDTAFETLVRRHGPMVLGVCCRVLGNVHDTADAFQATFLVLVRKAPSLLNRELVGNWLHGVAYRTALRARSELRRRQARMLQVDPMPEPKTTPQEPCADLLEILDREIARLPNKYRIPVILFELEGRSRKDVARQLKLPLGTLASRLASARKILTRRLARHAPDSATDSLATLFGLAALSVPRELLEATVLSARAIRNGTLAAGAVSAEVVSLTEGVVRSMLLSKLNSVLLFGLVAGVIAFVAGRGLGRTDESARNRPDVPKKSAQESIPEEIQKERAMNRLPSGRPPVQAWAKLADEKHLIVRQDTVAYSLSPKLALAPQAQLGAGQPGPTGQVPGAQFYTPTLMQCMRTFDLAKIQTLDMHDKPIGISDLARRLKKETLVLISADGQRVDPLHLRLFKEDTLLFIIPPTEPAIEPPPPGMVSPPPMIEGRPYPPPDRAAPGLSISDSEPRDDSAKKELENLEGTWVLAAIDIGEGRWPQDVTTDARTERTIRGNKWIGGQVGPNYKKSEGFLRIDPNKKPNWLDWSSTDAFKPGETYYQIYELEGNKLKICSAKDGKNPEDRPKEFKADAKTATTVAYWEKKP
jgi:RNA polymerase sigma factor (sigma-70 family)